MPNVDVPLSELPVNSMKVIEVDGDDVLVAHTVEGIFAISDICSHAEVSLAEGELQDCTVECWMHGSAFDLRTGQPLNPPAIAPVPTYQVVITNDNENPFVTVISRKKL